MQYWEFNPEVMYRTYPFVRQLHYPVRVIRRNWKWPEPEMIGMAMARGWAVPCRYYVMARGGYARSFVYPGITNMEFGYINAFMRQEAKK